MSENSTLRIHTQLTPEGADSGLKVERKQNRRSRHGARRNRRRSARPGFSERLLRNSAVACAVLLGVLALGNIRQPWAQKAAESIERALTMRIDLDESIGELSFVRRLMPESTRVFLNVSGGAGMTLPLNGEIEHAWSTIQPWMLFDGDNSPVSAAGAGTVTAISPLSDGQFGLLIDHGEGLESVYAGLSEVAVQTGESVVKGQRLGTCDDELYFELRQDGESVDPTERLGLR